jgi:hypothetical protein
MFNSLQKPVYMWGWPLESQARSFLVSCDGKMLAKDPHPFQRQRYFTLEVETWRGKSTESNRNELTWNDLETTFRNRMQIHSDELALRKEMKTLQGEALRCKKN